MEVRRSGRKREAVMYMDAYDEEKQLGAALRASLKDSQPTPSQDTADRKSRGHPKQGGAKVKRKEPQVSKPQPIEPPKSKIKRRKMVIKPAIGDQKKLSSKKMRFERCGPTLPPAADSSNDLAHTDEFVDFLCLRKSVPSKHQEGKNLSGDDESLVIAESDESSCEGGTGVAFKVFDFDDNNPEEMEVKGSNNDKNSDRNSSSGPQKPSKVEDSLKKRKLTQNFYNAKLRSSYDNAENSALESATVFRPTGEEFKNFHAYLEKMTPQLVASGMCKVIPPLAWRSPPVIQNDLRFNVKKQDVHRMCHRSGPSTIVLKQIKAHLFFDIGFEWKGLPQIGTTIVDLARFSWLMKKHGGLQVVIDKNKWSKLGDALGIPSVAERNEQLEEVYCKYLLSYDLLSDREKAALRVDEIDDANRSDGNKKMTLQSLRRYDKHAREVKFPSGGTASPTSLELEFWNLVCSAEEHFAAITGRESTLTHGSGFPAYEPRHIAQSDWNLTNLRHLPDGIIGFLPNVEFVTQPRLELSSLFSVSGWHVEPHFLPLISYNHFSHPRIWYSCPASQSDKFLSLLHDIVPRLGGGNHILDPGSVIIPPAELAARNISVCRAVQRPGEFILTAPMAYVCNFSLGVNVSEAVNFATEEWLHYGPSSLKLYQAWQLRPPLNIPQIICDVIDRHDSLNEGALRAAEPHLVTLLKQELEARAECSLPQAAVISDQGDVFCAKCQTICHLSFVRATPATSTESTKRKMPKKKDITEAVFCINHCQHITTGMLECKVSEDRIRLMLSTLEKRLYPKRSIVHPVQSLARSVCRELHKRDDTQPVSSPECPASPAENETRDQGLSLEIPTHPLPPQPPCQPSPEQVVPQTSEPCQPLVVPGSVRTTLHVPTSPVFRLHTSHSVVSTLPKPIPIKPIPSPMIPSLLVHPQKFSLPLPPPPPQEPPALWESYQPDMDTPCDKPGEK